MDAEQRGWYWQLLVEAWNSEDTCYLPNDPDLIWRLAGASNREHFESKSKLVLEQFRVARGGKKIYNVRQRDELLMLTEKCKKNADSGKRGANKRWRKGLRDSDPIANAIKPDSQAEAEPEPEADLDSKASSNFQSSQVTAAAAVLGSGSKNGTAAAFLDLGFDQPFGHNSFQTIWLSHYASAKAKGTWLSAAMEDAIQECQSSNVRVPPQFFEVKRDVEKLDQAEFERLHPRRASL